MTRFSPLFCGSCLERWVDGEVISWEVYWMVVLTALVQKGVLSVSGLFIHFYYPAFRLGVQTWLGYLYGAIFVLYITHSSVPHTYFQDGPWTWEQECCRCGEVDGCDGRIPALQSIRSSVEQSPDANDG